MLLIRCATCWPKRMQNGQAHLQQTLDNKHRVIYNVVYSQTSIFSPVSQAQERILWSFFQQWAFREPLWHKAGIKRNVSREGDIVLWSQSPPLVFVNPNTFQALQTTNSVWSFQIMSPLMATLVFTCLSLLKADWPCILRHSDRIHRWRKSRPQLDAGCRRGKPSSALAGPPCAAVWLWWGSSLAPCPTGYQLWLYFQHSE